MEKQIKILVVEDEITSTIFLKRLLVKNNYDVKVTYNGSEGLKELELNKYDVVLTDWMMPELDGIELIRRIRENIQPLPYIIMLTALASEGAKNHALNSGADDYLAKPIDVNELLDKIQLGLKKKNNEKDENAAKNFTVKKRNKLPNFVGSGIVTSTGGPSTIVDLVNNLNKDSLASYFVVQHGPPWMIETFTKRLKNETKLKVNLAESGMKVEMGNIYLYLPR